MSSQLLAVLVDPGVPAPLEELLQDYPLPLVPMGTKPLLSHWLDRLHRAGVSDVLMLLEHLPEKTREWLSSNTPDGMTISCANIRKGQPFKTQYAHLSGNENRPVFAIELSAFPVIDLVDALMDAAHQSPLVSVSSLSGWAQRLSRHISVPIDEISAETLVPISLPRDIWQINMDLLAETLHDPYPFGFQPEEQCYVASNCKIAGDVRYRAPIAIGESCIFSSRVNVGPNVVAAEKCVFDEGCFVQDSVVFGRTFVGANAVLRNAVVTGSVVYLVDEDRLVHIDDAELLASPTAVISVGLGERLVAMMTLLLLVMPLGLFSVYQMLRKRPVLVEEEIFLEAGRDLNGLREFRYERLQSLNTTHRGWKKVPWLLAVIKYKLPLVGTSPRNSRSFEYPSWVTEAEVFRPGVITLADLTLEQDAANEEVIIADAYQLAKGDVGFCFGMWWRWLISLFTFKLS